MNELNKLFKAQGRYSYWVNLDYNPRIYRINNTTNSIELLSKISYLPTRWRPSIAEIKDFYNLELLNHAEMKAISQQYFEVDLGWEI